MKIVIAGQKGGCGKSMVAMLLALAFAKSGRRVGVVDLGGFQTISDWIKCLHPVGGMIRPAEHGEWDICLIDLCSRASLKTMSECAHADLVIAVATNSPLDQRMNEETAMLLAEVAPETPARVLMNQVLSDNFDRPEAYFGVPTFRTHWRNRQSFAAIAGPESPNLDNLSLAATIELWSLASELYLEGGAIGSKPFNP